jgi:hypothetical protein
MLMGDVGVGPHVMFVFPEGTGRILKGLAHDPTSGLPYVAPPLPDRVPEWAKTGLSLCSSFRLPSRTRQLADAQAGAPVAATARPTFTPHGDARRTDDAFRAQPS